MSRKKQFWGLLIPRPHSFMANSLIFSGGVFFALLEGYSGHAGPASAVIPAWLFVLLWWLVQELLVQQAKYMLNDSRDREDDQKIPANQIRPIACRQPSKSVPIVMGVRWISGIFLALWLSPDMLIVVLFISVLQIIYELWAKPYAARHPKRPLFVVAAGTVLKFSGGALAVGWPAGDQRLWFYGLAFLATGVVYVSSFWRVEAGFFAERRMPRPRSQSAYFARTGMTWFTAGSAVMIATCTILIFDGYTHFLIHTGMGTSLVLSLIIAFGILCCQLLFGLASFGSGVRYTVVALWVIACSVTLFFGVGSVLPIPRASISAVILMLFLLINHGLNYHTDYQRQNLIYFAKNWADLKRRMRSRPGHVSNAIQWRDIPQLLLALNTPKYEILIRQRRSNRGFNPAVGDGDSQFQNQEALGGGRPS